MKHLYIFTFIVLSLPGWAQQPDSSISASILPVKKYPYLQLDVGFGALSNSLSTIELARFVSDDFLDKQEKDKLLGSIPSSLRYGYFRSIKAGYHEPGYNIYDVYKKGWGVSLRNTYYNSARINKDMLNLIFYGNKPYAGTTINAGKSASERWYFTSFDYHFDVMVDTLLPIHLTTSIHAGHYHSHYNVNKAQLYTEPVGEYLDADLNYMTENAGSTTPLGGLGASIGATIDIPIRHNGIINLAVEDLGVMYWTQGEVLKVDSSFRFEGIYFDNIFDLNDSIRNQASENYKDAFYYSDVKNYMRLMPFSIAARYRHRFANKKRLREVMAEVNYRYLAGYIPQLRLGARIKTGYKHYITAMATAGGYTWAGLDVGYHFEIGYDWKVDIALHNLNGLLIPVLSGGTYATLGVSYRL